MTLGGPLQNMSPFRETVISRPKNVYNYGHWGCEPLLKRVSTTVNRKEVTRVPPSLQNTEGLASAR